MHILKDQETRIFKEKKNALKLQCYTLVINHKNNFFIKKFCVIKWKSDNLYTKT